MFRPATYLELCMAMQSGAPVTMGIQNHNGTITKIEKEDGSGRCFNVTLQPDYEAFGLAKPVVVFFRENILTT